MRLSRKNYRSGQEDKSSCFQTIITELHPMQLAFKPRPLCCMKSLATNPLNRDNSVTASLYQLTVRQCLLSQSTERVE